MKKINSIFKIIILFFIIIFLRNSKVYANYDYTVLNNCGSEAPTIFVFHGIGSSEKELGKEELAAYKLIKNKEINIDATLVYLRKEKGEWNSSTAADTSELPPPNLDLK